MMAMKKDNWLAAIICTLLILMPMDSWAAARLMLTPTTGGVRRDLTSPRPSSKFMLLLEGANCRISEVDGETKVEVQNASGEWEEVETDNGDSSSFDWARTAIYAGSMQTSESQDISLPFEIGTCNITMTGGEVFGIYGGGFAIVMSEDNWTGKVRGTVNVNISGGSIYEVKHYGSNGLCNIVDGSFNLIMTGGEYIGPNAPSLHNSYDVNYKDYEGNNVEVRVEVPTTAIVTNVTYEYEDAAIVADPSSEDFCKATGCLVQNASRTNYYMSGVLTNELNLSVPRMTIFAGAVLTNNATIDVTRCAAFTNNGTVVNNQVNYINRHALSRLVNIPATCTENGLVIDKCDNCSYMARRTLSKTGHQNIKTEPAVSATCTEAGHSAYDYCEDCGTKTSMIMITKPLGHNLSATSYSDKHGSYTNTYKRCTRCNYRAYDPAENKLTGHRFEETDNNNATCTKDGTITMTCSCRVSYTMTKENSALGHDAQLIAQANPTCTADGHRAYYQCNRCQKYSFDGRNDERWADFLLAKALKIPAYGHEFSKQSQVPAALATEATCTEAATYHYSCNRCGEVQTGAGIPVFEGGSPLGHDYSISLVSPETQHPDEGVATLVCGRCHRGSNFMFGQQTISKRSLLTSPKNSAKATLNAITRVPTCHRTGLANYNLTINVGEQELASSYNATLPMIENRHLWLPTGNCSYTGCTEHAAASMQWPLTFTTDEGEEVYMGGEAYSYASIPEAFSHSDEWHSVDGDLAKIDIYEDGDVVGTYLRNLNMEMNLHNHTLSSTARGFVANGSCVAVIDGALAGSFIEDGDEPTSLLLDNATISTHHFEWTCVEKANGSSLNVSLQDGVMYDQPVSVDADNLTYTRTFNNTKLQALYLPFSMGYDAWAADFDVYTINNLTQYDSDGDGTLDLTNMYVEKVQAGMELLPHCPYLIKAKTTGQKTFTLTNATLCPYDEEQVPVECSSTTRTYSFLGTYSRVNVPLDAYAMSGGSLMQPASEGVALSPFRWYMVKRQKPAMIVGMKTNDVKAINIFELGEDGNWELDEETSLDELMGEAESEYYNANGIRTASLHRGLNIIKQNGLTRKVYVK